MLILVETPSGSGGLLSGHRPREAELHSQIRVAQAAGLVEIELLLYFVFSNNNMRVQSRDRGHVIGVRSCLLPLA